MSKIERTTVGLGIAGGTLAFVLFALAIITQGSQGAFQISRPPADYAALLLARATILRLDLGIDFIFLIVYAAFFVLLAQVLRTWDVGNGEVGLGGPIALGTAALLVTALLDAVENTHILGMLAMAEQGQPIAFGQIIAQSIESQIKFLFSYFGLFLLSFALPAETLIEKAVVLSLRWLQAPIGVAIFALPLEHARPFFILCAIFFFVGLWSMAWIVARRAAKLHK